MTEKDLKARLAKKMRVQLLGCVVLRHEDLFTSGIPDISLTWRMRTIWVEVKFVRKNGILKMREVQKLTCQKLGAWVVIYEEHKIFGPRTHLIRAADIDEWKEDVHALTNGYNHDFVIKELRICAAL